jgi:hypothetical protein
VGIGSAPIEAQKGVISSDQIEARRVGSDGLQPVENL